MNRILILGGGMGGFYVAKGLSKNLSKKEAQITVVDMRGCAVYQPFLAEVIGGSIEPRHIEVPLQRHLPKCKVIQAKVTGINNAEKKVTVVNKAGYTCEIEYDTLVVSLGGVTRTFPIPGVADNAVGLKATEEAVYVRDTLIDNISSASILPEGSAERKKLLTFITVGGGFSGMEGFAEAYALACKLCKTFGVDKSELEFHVIEAANRIMPELKLEQAEQVVKTLEKRGAHIHLETQLVSAVDGVCETNTGLTFDAGLIMWTAGQMANPVLRNSDLPLDQRGRLMCKPDLRVATEDGEIVEGVWGLGDCSHVEDMSSGGLPDGTCAPTAQHAVRQGKQLVKNIVATIKGGEIADYVHENAGMVAGLGGGTGAFTSGHKKLTFNGWVAWMGHRFYHGFAMPSWERKLRIWGDWTSSFIIKRDTTTTTGTSNPRAFFEEFASRPKE